MKLGWLLNIIGIIGGIPFILQMASLLEGVRFQWTPLVIGSMVFSGLFLAMGEERIRKVRKEG